ncbi:hypothetical protein ACJW31_08G138200 [Castanea mollissima]
MERAFQLLFESKVWFVALVFLSTQTTDIERGREKQIIKKGDLVPIWYFRLTHYSHQAELFDSKVGTNLLDIISQSKAVSSGGTKTKLEERECGRWRGKVWDGSEFFSARLMVLYMMGEKWVAWLGIFIFPWREMHLRPLS